MEQQPKYMNVHVCLWKPLKPAKSSLELAAWLITWFTEQLLPGLIPIKGKLTLVAPTTTWRSGLTSTWVTSTPRMRPTQAPLSVSMSGSSSKTTSLSTSTGILSKELHHSIQLQKFAGSVFVKSFTSSFTLRMPLSIKGQSFSPNVGIRTPTSWQITRKSFKKISLSYFHFSKFTRATAIWIFLQFLSYVICFIFIFVILCSVIYATLINSSSNEQNLQSNLNQEQN